MEEHFNFPDLPIGFGMALAENPAAMARFCALPEEERQAAVARAHNVRSKAEMHALVRSF